MTPDEEKQMTTRALTSACERAGLDPAKAAAGIRLGIIGDEVVPMSATGHRLISTHADRSFIDIDEAVQDYAHQHPEARTGRPDTDQKCGLPEKLFDALSPTAKLQYYYKSGGTARKPEPPRKRPPTMEESAQMKGMGTIERLRFARRTGICQ